MSLKPIDMFVYGAVVALTGNSGKAQIIHLEHIMNVTGMSEFQVVISLKNIKRLDLLNVIFMEDHACVQVCLFIPEMLGSAA